MIEFGWYGLGWCLWLVPMVGAYGWCLWLVPMVEVTTTNKSSKSENMSNYVINYGEFESICFGTMRKAEVVGRDSNQSWKNTFIILNPIAKYAKIIRM